jgi:hypothetical protein
MPRDNQGEPLPGFWFGWRGRHYPGTPMDDLWVAIGAAPDGSWWFGAHFIGRVAMLGGASTAAAFARWVLSAPSGGRYENEFLPVPSSDAPLPDSSPSARPSSDAADSNSGHLNAI